jgi:iron(III) transport system ATP-binding protein
MAEVAIDRVSKGFGQVQALRRICLEVQDGEFLTVLGPSGSGKTTLLRLIAGLEVPDGGQIVIGGRAVCSPEAWVPPQQRNIGMVFQNYALWPHLTAFENVAFPLQMAGLRAPEITTRVREVMDLVELSRMEQKRPGELSGGEQQRVALARALIGRPSILLMDECLSNLDARLRDKMAGELRRIQAAVGITTIYVTHDQEEALNLADEVAVLFEGRLAQTDTPHNLYRRPATRQVATFLGEANFIPGQASQGRVSCELGQFQTDSIYQGRVEVMLRPEDLILSLDEAGPAKVVGREYFGHDQLVLVQVPSGTHLRARLLGSAGDFYPGQRVSLHVRDSVVVYPSPTLATHSQTNDICRRI